MDKVILVGGPLDGGEVRLPPHVHEYQKARDTTTNRYFVYRPKDRFEVTVTPTERVRVFYYQGIEGK